MKYLKLNLIFLFIFVFCFNVYSADRIIIDISKGSVEKYYKEVQEWASLNNNLELLVHDKIKTLEGSIAKLLYSDGTVMRLKEGTELEIGIASVKLKLGSVWVRVIKKGSRFEVVTPSAIAGVRGTIFSVDVNSLGNSRVSVFEGVVKVSNSSGFIVLTNGFHNVVKKGKRPSLPQKLISAVKSMWASWFEKEQKAKKANNEEKENNNLETSEKNYSSSVDVKSNDFNYNENEDVEKKDVLQDSGNEIKSLNNFDGLKIK